MDKGSCEGEDEEESEDDWEEVEGKTLLCDPVFLFESAWSHII